MRDSLRKPKSLRTLFIILFLFQSGVFLGLSYLLFEQFKQRTISNLLTALTIETSERINNKISQELHTAIRLNAINRDVVAITNGTTNYNSLIRAVAIQLNNFPNISAIGVSQVGGYSFRVNRYGATPNQFDVELLSPERPNELQIFRVNSVGNKLVDLVTIRPFKVTDWPWYKSIQNIKPNSWSQPYISREGSNLVISTYIPIYPTDTYRLPTLFVSSISLEKINTLLEGQQFKVKSLALITELSGELVGATTRDKPYSLVRHKNEPGYSFKRTHIQDSSNPLLVSLAPLLPQASTLKPGESRLESLIFAGNRYYVEIERLNFDPSLDWLLITVISEAELTQDIQKNLIPILFLLALLLVMMGILNLVTAQAIIRPIRTLQNRTREFVAPHTSLETIAHPIKEISELDSAFVEMAQKIHITLNQLQTTNHELVEQKAHLCQILDAIPIGVAIHALHGQVEYLNPAGMSLLGLTAIPNSPGLDALNQDFYLFQVGQNCPYPTELLPAVQALHGQTTELDDLEFRQGEHHRIFKAYGIPIYNQAREITAALVIFLDITERKHLEDILQNYNQTLAAEVRQQTLALAKSEEKFRFALQSTVTSWWDWDPVNNLIDWSDNFYPMIGRPAEACEKTVEAFMTFLHPDDQAHVGAAIQNTLIHDIPYRVEFRFLHPDGAICWILAVGTVQRDETGQAIRMSGINLDITERKTIEEALRKSEERFRQSFNTTAVSSALVGLNGRFIAVNPALCEFFGYSEDELKDISLNELTDAGGSPLRTDLIEQLLNRVISSYSLENCYQHRLGHQVWGLLTVSLVRDDHEQPLYYICQIQNIDPLKQIQAELQQVNTELEYLTQIDSLTGVFNRRYFDQVLAQEWQVACREGDYFALLMLDIDYFKNYNDALGHQAGDSCLIQVAQALQRSIHRSSDLVARYGGEEFVLILPRTDLSGAVVIAQRIQDLISAQDLPHPTSAISHQLTVSIGIQCGIPRPGQPPQTWLRAADDALYLAKEKGRNQYVVNGSEAAI
ncbi:diguanylate cyclase [Thermosynechococcaceae cyanobacterium BACA0444]|uniref:Diguanylate cyclase n=1 Tax=Pseudocalidococcus azoricus BACA0444 TaxID=2918990 RepID=A0AAE4FS50_9CYAN|nr:diguanylate cyclase [Pseudocalidococcus azoricus]MDS3860327.1 diguanylate cyclase [Pseudocalidococcus azoricus BACA0444]